MELLGSNFLALKAKYAATGVFASVSKGKRAIAAWDSRIPAKKPRENACSIEQVFSRLR